MGEVMKLDLINKLANVFYKLAGDYEQFKDKVEELAKKNPRPFGRWFPAGDRVYIPYRAEGDFSEYDKFVIDFFTRQGYSVDWIGGYVEKGNRKESLVKVLTKIERLKINEAKKGPKSERRVESIKKFFENLKDTFQESKVRKSGNKKLLIAISQDPHDIAKMSTDRGWTSCMNLVDGAHKESVYCEVSDGGLIAYLIKENDKEIKKPLARVLIRRYVNKEGKSHAVLEDQIYGTADPGFWGTVKKWLDDRQVQTKGVYKRKGGEYSDSLKSELFPDPSDLESEVKTFIMGGRPIPESLLFMVMGNKKKVSSEIFENVQAQIFDNLSNHENRNFIKKHPQILLDYLNQDPSKIDKTLAHFTNDDIDSIIKTIHNNKPLRENKISPMENILRSKLFERVSEQIPQREQNAPRLTSEDNDKDQKYFQRGDFLRLKIESCPPDKLLDVGKEVLLDAEKNLDEKALSHTAFYLMSKLYSENMVNLRAVVLMKPYIEMMWERDPGKAFYNSMHFLNKAGHLARFMLPKLQDLLKTLKPESMRYKQCKALMSSLEGGGFSSLHFLE